MSAVKDYQAAAALAEDVNTSLSDEQKEKCRRVIAEWYDRMEDVTPREAVEIMMALGVHPSQKDEEGPVGLRITSLHQDAIRPSHSILGTLP